MTFRDMILNLVLQADTRKAVAEMNSAGEAVQKLGEKAEEAGTVGGDGQEELANQTSLAAGQVGNLAAQFNDIGVMMAAGQNPLQLALQQGTQITQVIGHMGATGAVRALGAAFMSLLSPVNLITLGAIAAGAAMIQWLGEAEEEAMSLDDALDRLTEATDRLAQSDGLVAAPRAAIEEYQNLIAVINEVDQLERNRAARATIEATGLPDAMAKNIAANSIAQQMGAAPVSFDFMGLDTINEANFLLERTRELMAASRDEQAGALDEMVEALTLRGLLTTEVKDFVTLLSRELGITERLVAAEKKRTDETTRHRGDRTTAEELAGDLRQEVAIKEAIAQYGENSAQVENLRIGYARELFQAKVANLQITEQERVALLALWEQLQQVRATERERANTATAEKLLADLQTETQLRKAIAVYGEDSVVVAELRAAAEQEAREALLQSLNPSAELEESLRAAFKASADAERATAGWASQMAGVRAEVDGILSSLASLGGGVISNAGKQAEIEALRAGKSIREASVAARASQREAEFDARSQGASWAERLVISFERGVAKFGDELDRELDAEREAARKRDQTVAGRGGGGGRHGQETFASVSDEANEALFDLELSIAAINEKVQAGLLSTAEGQEAIRSATEASANQIAELIPKLEQASDAAGPAGAAKVAEMRAALKGLAKDLNGAAEGVGKTFSDSLGGALTDFIGGAKNAKDAFSDFANDMLAQINRIVAQRFANAFITPFVDSLLSVLPFAQGGVPGSGDLAQWSDTVDDRPIAFAMPGQPGQVGIAREAGKEAILPVRQGGRGEGVLATDAQGRETVAPLKRTASGALGVSLPAPQMPAIMQRPTFFAQGGVLGRFAQGSAGGDSGTAASPAAIPSEAPRVTVNVTNAAPGAEARQQERMEGNERIVEILIEQVEAGIASNMSRNVGPLSGVMSGAFGLQRQPR